MTFRFFGEPQEDKRLRQMILISAVLHVVVIVWVVVSASLNSSTQPRAVAFTVDLINPAALGTNLPGGAGKATARAEVEPTAPPKPPVAPPSPKQETKPPPAPPPQVVKKEEPKLPPPAPPKEEIKIPEKEKLVEKLQVKPEPEKIKAEEKKPEVKKPEPKPEPLKTAKVEERPPEAKKAEPKPEPPKAEVKPETEKIPPKKPEEKKPEPQKAETKPQKVEAQSEKIPVKSEKSASKPETDKPPGKAAEKNGEEKPPKSEVAAPSPEERERQIAAALDRIKAQVQPKEDPEFSESAKGSGPVTKGGEVGEGGGGVVRGLEFILYTQQLQKRVQESWIVTEKRPGLVASVSFKIQPDGDVQEVELTKSSGDGAFDQSVLRAVRKAAPFPPPPQSYAQEFASQKIVMNFGGEGRVN